MRRAAPAGSRSLPVAPASGSPLGESVQSYQPAVRTILEQVADELTRRVISLFQTDQSGNRMEYGKHNWFYKRPGNEHLMLFYEYFQGDTGEGLGASHQTGWTALVAELIREQFAGKEPVVQPVLTLEE